MKRFGEAMPEFGTIRGTGTFFVPTIPMRIV
jgi:hypothetical protein